MLLFDVIRYADATDDNACPDDEIDRRERVSQLSVSIKVYVNGKRVKQTGTKTINLEFEAVFNEVYKLRLYERPHDIRYDVCHTHVLSKKPITLSQVYVPIPINTSGVDAPVEEMHFASDRSAKNLGITAHSDDRSDVDTITGGRDDSLKMKVQVIPGTISGILAHSSGWGSIIGSLVQVPPISRPQQVMEALSLQRAAKLGV